MESLGPTLPWPLGVAWKQDVLVGFDVNLQARVVWEEGTSVEKVPPPDCLMDKPVEHFID